MNRASDQPPVWSEKYLQALRSFSVHGFRTVGPEQVPVLAPLASLVRPGRLEPFSRWHVSRSAPDTALHFYVNDRSMQFAVTHPLRWVDRLSSAVAVISPDLSLFHAHPPCVRRFHTLLNRIAAATWQEAGIKVIPNVRWNDRTDYVFCFDGLPKHSQVAVSSVTMLRDRIDRRNFIHGFEEMLEQLSPRSVIWHGAIPTGISSALLDSVEIIRFDSRIARVHLRGAFNGGG